MLAKLLHEIQTRGTVQPAVLANRLGTSAAMVEAMLDDLKRRGLLSEVNLNRGEPCGGCSLSNSCVSLCDRGRLWKITPETR